MTVIGVDVGGSWIKAARFSRDLLLEQQVRVRSGATAGIEALFTSIAEAIRAVQTDTATPIGLALPSPIKEGGTHIHFMANVSGMNTYNHDGIGIAELLEKHGDFGPSIAANDAACAALGEWQVGIARGALDTRLLHVTWGTGIGTGFVVAGQSQHGWEGGHVPLTTDPTGPTIETEIQVAALLARARDLLRSGGTTSDLRMDILRDPVEGSKHLVQVAQSGDALAQEVLREAAAVLAYGLHVMALLAYPTLVTIGGGLMASDWLLDQVRYEVDKQSVGTRQTSLVGAMVKAATLGNQAGMVGAAILAQKIMHHN